MEKINGTPKRKVKKVVIIGPECTGKSTLASLLAKYYDTEWVPEYARYYLERLERPYEEKDLITIAKGQLKWEDEKLSTVSKLLICDTDLLVIKIWSEHKYGACYEEILNLMRQRSYDLYLLTDIDIEWDDDPQRENPHLREFFFNTFKKELEDRGLPYVKISGDFYNRKKTAVKAIDNLLKNEPTKK